VGADPLGDAGQPPARAARESVREPKLERIDLLAGSLQSVEDPAGVVERTRVTAAETEERENRADEPPGIRWCRHRR
jgi:hypothetical protein